MESLPEGLLAAWESALLKTTGAMIVLAIEGEEGEPTLLLGEGNRFRWTFGESEPRIHLVSDGSAYFVQLSILGRSRGKTSAVLRNNLVVGFSRLGIRGSYLACHRALRADPDISEIDSRISIDQYTERPVGEKGIEVSYKAHFPAFWPYTVRVEFDSQKVSPRVRVITNEVNGATSTERFTQHELDIPWAGDDFCLEV